MAHILQVNYSLPLAEMSPEEKRKLMKMATEGAQKIAQTPGLRWKTYLLNKKTNEVGGIYLFEDENSLKTYLEGPIVTERKAGKFGKYKLSNLRIKSFEVLDELSKITRAPV